MDEEKVAAELVAVAVPRAWLYRALGGWYLRKGAVAIGPVLLGEEPLAEEPPDGSVVLDRHGGAWQRRDDEWFTTNCFPAEPALDWPELNRKYGPVRVGVFRVKGEQCVARSADGHRCRLAAGHPGHPGLSLLTDGLLTDEGHAWEVAQP